MLSFRFVTPDDASDLREIYRPSVSETAASFEEVVPSLEEMRERIISVSAQFPWIVVQEGSRIIGYAYASTHNPRVSYRWSVNVSVYVSDRGRGVGRELYARLFNLLRELRYHRVYAGITLPNEASVRLHESFGFTKCAHYSAVGFKFGAWHDVGWWELKLSEQTSAPLEPRSVREHARPV